MSVQVIANGIAARTQRLRIGDRIVRINGKNVTGFTHAEAIRALSDPNPQMILTVRHDPPPEGLQELLIQRKDGEQYGIKIIGGLRTHESYQKVYDSGIFVASIHRGGVIGRDGHLKVSINISQNRKVNKTNGNSSSYKNPLKLAEKWEKLAKKRTKERVKID